MAISCLILLECSILYDITNVRTKTLFDVNDYIDIAFESLSKITFIGRLASNQNAVSIIVGEIKYTDRQIGATPYFLFENNPRNLRQKKHFTKLA